VDDDDDDNNNNIIIENLTTPITAVMTINTVL
jgi:hypothetical protein